MTFVGKLTPAQCRAFASMREEHERMRREANEFLDREMHRIIAMPHLFLVKSDRG